MIVALPPVPYQITRPVIVDSVSVSRTGERAISFVEYADPFWQTPMKTVPLDAAQLMLVEAFREQARTGRNTVLYTPKHVCLPQAYWGNPTAPALVDGRLASVVNGFTVNLAGLINGLVLMRGDLFSLEFNGYRSLHRVMSGGTAASGAMSVTVEPFVPPYIATGAVAKFLRPELNTRVVPGSFSITDDFLPVATFTLVEVPK